MCDSLTDAAQGPHPRYTPAADHDERRLGGCGARLGSSLTFTLMTFDPYRAPISPATRAASRESAEPSLAWMITLGNSPLAGRDQIGVLFNGSTQERRHRAAAQQRQRQVGKCLIGFAQGRDTFSPQVGADGCGVDPGVPREPGIPCRRPPNLPLIGAQLEPLTDGLHALGRRVDAADHADESDR